MANMLTTKAQTWFIGHNMSRDPSEDPQVGDCFAYRAPFGMDIIRVVHRREEWVWLCSYTTPLVAFRVDQFAATLLLHGAEYVNNLLDEEKLWRAPVSQDIPVID